MSKSDPFKYFKTSPEIIRLAVMYYVRYPLSFRQVEDILHDRGIDICHETVRYWVARFGKLIAKYIRNKRKGKCSNWQWHLDEVFVKINGVRHYLWRAIDQDGKVLECYVSKKQDAKTAIKFIVKSLRRFGYPKIIVTDGLTSYPPALEKLQLIDRHITGRRLNNRCENSHLPFRRRERAMQRFKSAESLEHFTDIQGPIYNHFNHERHLISRQAYKEKRITALNEWYGLAIA